VHARPPHFHAPLSQLEHMTDITKLMQMHTAASRIQQQWKLFKQRRREWALAVIIRYACKPGWFIYNRAKARYDDLIAKI
jgi:hypothetical protein